MIPAEVNLFPTVGDRCYKPRSPNVPLKPGSRLRSQVCTTEVIVVRLAGGHIDLRCGGEPMVEIGAPPAEGKAPIAGLDGGAQLGKRYTSQEIDALELLVTKAGAGTLAVGDTPLVVMAARSLPSSD
jgi:hypothetical protein